MKKGKTTIRSVALPQKKIVNKVTFKISEDQIIKYCKSSKFIKRQRKITVGNLVLGLIKCYKQSAFSYRLWALQISILLADTVSKQAISKRLNSEAKGCFSSVLQSILSERLFGDDGAIIESNFNRILVRDSTCIKLSKALSDFFPGAHSKNGASATLRIQHQMDLKKEESTYFKLSHFRDNDQANSMELLDDLQANDLVLEDLGYFKLDKFAQIALAKAFFISRFKYKVSTFDLEGHRFDLMEYLKDLRDEIDQVDIDILIGQKIKFPVRLVALSLPKEKADERKRKAKKNRDQRSNHSKNYFCFLEWTILITNIPKPTFEAKVLWKIYGLRWRIEILFKCWKQRFNLSSILGQKKIRNPICIYVLVYGFLIYLTACILPSFNAWAKLMYKERQKFLSLYKFIDLIITPGICQTLFDLTEVDYTLAFLEKFACYDQRKNRQNHFLQMQAIFKGSP